MKPSGEPADESGVVTTPRADVKSLAKMFESVSMDPERPRSRSRVKCLKPPVPPKQNTMVKSVDSDISGYSAHGTRRVKRRNGQRRSNKTGAVVVGRAGSKRPRRKPVRTEVYDTCDIVPRGSQLDLASGCGSKLDLCGESGSDDLRNGSREDLLDVCHSLVNNPPDIYVEPGSATNDCVDIGVADNLSAADGRAAPATPTRAPPPKPPKPKVPPRKFTWPSATCSAQQDIAKDVPATSTDNRPSEIPSVSSVDDSSVQGSINPASLCPTDTHRHSEEPPIPDVSSSQSPGLDTDTASLSVRFRQKPQTDEAIYDCQKIHVMEHLDIPDKWRILDPRPDAAASYAAYDTRGKDTAKRRG